MRRPGRAAYVECAEYAHNAPRRVYIKCRERSDRIEYTESIECIEYVEGAERGGLIAQNMYSAQSAPIVEKALIAWNIS